ncbi:MAG TPA: hypothetical protein VGK28_09145 [Candidatus Dormibacteraeota bacterium]|jgi:hypothetical protein
MSILKCVRLVIGKLRSVRWTHEEYERVLVESHADSVDPFIRHRGRAIAGRRPSPDSAVERPGGEVT